MLHEPFAQLADGGVVDIEFLGENTQEALAPGGVEGEIGAAEIGGAGPRRDLAAAASRQARSCSRSCSASSRGSSGRGAPLSTPRAELAISRHAVRTAQIAERALDHIVEEAGCRVRSWRIRDTGLSEAGKRRA